MKNNYFLKTVFTMLLCGSISMSYAADLYLSNAGVDTNDGLSAGTPVKTLSKAFTMSLAGDVIHVMNMININEEPVGTGARATIDITGTSTSLVLSKNGVIYTTWNAVNGTLGIIPHTRSLTIVGDDKATCGFDGNNVSCIIRHDHATGTAVIDYKNLTFKNGKTVDQSGGGAVYVRQTNTLGGQAANFYNCEFTDNVNAHTSGKPGGAVCVLPGTANFKLCHFARNFASKGGALYIERGTVTVDSCVFEDNDLTATTTTTSAASSGSALLINGITSSNVINLDVKNTLFKNNKAGAKGGAFATSEDVNASGFKSTAIFTNCAFVNNTSGTGGGGAAYISNAAVNTTLDISFINSTFYNNLSGVNTGGGLFVYSLLANSKFNMINCTVSGNKVAGTTGAGGAGVRFLKGTANSTRKVLNCILENNTAVDANLAMASDYADLGMEDIVNVDFTTTPSYVAGTTLVVDKSIIAGCKNTDFSTQFPSNNTNYVAEVNGSITNSFVAKLGEFNVTNNYFPLLAGSSAIGYGSAAYLSSLTPAVTTDQIGRNRPATTCSAGAYEFATVVLGLKNAVNNSISVYKNANNQITVHTAATNLSGTVTLYNMVGKVLFSSPIQGSTTTINKSLSSGVYLVKVQSNGNISAQKVILN
ncbi:MAG: T9SS type A sorting domain-containing protein [Bacteroidia bacterium]|nr:T9SS type A sorting domain-containing protein [Bacteroidia bacterium]